MPRVNEITIPVLIRINGRFTIHPWNFSSQCRSHVKQDSSQRKRLHKNSDIFSAGFLICRQLTYDRFLSLSKAFILPKTFNSS